MYKYKCSCGELLHNKRAFLNHVRYHRKYDPIYFIYKVTWWRKLFFYMTKNIGKTFKIIGWITVIETIITHDQTYSWVEKLLLLTGIALII